MILVGKIAHMKKRQTKEAKAMYAIMFPPIKYNSILKILRID